MNRTFAFLAAALVLGASTTGLAADSPAKAKSPAPAPVAVVSKKSKQMGKPPAELQKLAGLLGSWSGETHLFAGDAKSPSKATFTWTMNGMHLEGEHQVTMNGKPMAGHSTWGYDPDRNQYQCAWTDAMTSAVTLYAGTFTDDTTLFLSSTSVVDGKPVTDIMSIKFDAPGKYTLVLTSDASGESKPVMEETASRSGGAGDHAEKSDKEG